jgi:predicted dehydrogenase
VTRPQVGLVGFGRWGRLIFRDLRALGADVHVATPSPSSRAAADDAGAVTTCDQPAALPDLDGYVVASPTSRHAESVRALVDRGRPIFVEKPLTDDPRAAEELVAVAGDRLFVMDKWRYHPGVRELSRMTRAGAFGRVLAIRTYRLGWGNPHTDVDSVWILLPHDLSIAIDLLGRLPAPRLALAPAGPTAGSDLLAVLGDEEGPVVTCEVSSSQPVNRRSVVVVGDRGSGQLADSYDDSIVLSGEVEGRSITEQTRLRHVGSEMPLEAELRTFLDHLAGGPSPASSADEGLAVVRTIAQLRQMAGLA